MTLEFLGPLAVALGTSRSRIDALCALLAGVGVVVLVARGSTGDYVGIGLALIAAGCWADGLGPTLTSISFRADAVSNVVGTDADTASRLLADIRHDLRAAVPGAFTGQVPPGDNQSCALVPDAHPLGPSLRQAGYSLCSVDNGWCRPVLMPAGTIPVPRSPRHK